MKEAEKKIQMKCTVERIRYYKDNFGIIVVQVNEVTKGTLLTDRRDTILKGEMPKVKEGESYKVSATYEEDSKWGGQYTINMITSNITVTDSDVVGQRKFLESIFTTKQVEAMYEVLDNPFMSFKEERVEDLVIVKGCGLYRAADWLLRFQQNFFRSKIYAELEDYNLSSAIIDKLIDRYKSPDLVIEKIKNNPYILITEVKGIGWAIADRIAVAGGMDKYDPKRIAAYIYNYLNEQGDKGFSWIDIDHLWGAVIENFGDDIPDEVIAKGIQELGEETLWWNKEKTKIGLRYYYVLEDKIAGELLRILNAESKVKPSDWQDAIVKIERLQGWQYTEEQKNGIKLAIDNNVVLIQGSAGSGKSSLVRVFLEASKGYSFVQCALSGKAASRLMEVTGQEGFTIHRLLGYPKGPSNKKGFYYNDEQQLNFDIYIIDEISMVDLELFYNLLRAIPSGSKVIMLGDHGQLEAIGSGNIAYDILASEEIPSMTLTQIHRQAQESAIVTESIKVRDKKQLTPKDWYGHEVRGVLKDLDITCYSDLANTYYEIMKCFAQVYDKDKNIMEIQVIVPNRYKGAGTYMLNNALQEVCNPMNADKKEIEISNYKNPYVIRPGDKVINTVNNYKTEPNIYNGNIGIVKGFGRDEEEDCDTMIIDFEGIGEVKLIEKYWKSIELAYALTVHKEQGDQHDVVIFGLDFGAYVLLSKELVYTGITRAKKKCYLIAQNNALRYAIGKSSVTLKQTHLKERLHEIAHPVIVF